MAKTKNDDVQGFLKVQLEEAQKRLTQLEGEAQKVLKQLVARGQKSREEIEALLTKLSAAELAPTVMRKANEASVEVKKRLDALQTRVVEATGVASQSQVRAIGKELARLSKKVDSLVTRKGKPEVRA